MRLLLFAAGAALCACKGSSRAPAPDELTPAERAELAKLSPLGDVPPDPTNRYADDPRAAKLGQMWFFDKSLAGPIAVASDLGAVGEVGKVSCHSCHGGPALDDQRSQPNHVSIGTAIGTRNALPVVNSAYYTWTNWGGRFDSQWSLVLGAAEKPEIMNTTRLRVAHVLFAKYRAEYDALFPPLDPALDPAAPDAARFPADGKPKASADAPDGAWEAMAPADREIVNTIYVSFGKAIAAYMRKVVSRDAPFDRYVAGDRAAISDEAKRGIRTYLAHCASCHGGPHLANPTFHALAAAQFGAHVPEVDLGRFADVPALLASPFNTAGPYSDERGGAKLAGLAQAEAQRGQFRTPTLRNVADSAPYMHAGQLATLEAVVTFYNVGGGRVSGIVKDPEMKPLGLTDAQQAELVALMKTFTGQPVAAELLVDTSKP